jgi:hypothetical protein
MSNRNFTSVGLDLVPLRVEHESQVPFALVYAREAIRMRL